MERFADFSIPSGLIEQFEVKRGDVPISDADTVSVRLIKVIRHAIGSKYQIVGTPIPPAITSANIDKSDLAELRDSYEDLQKAARAQLMARLALRESESRGLAENR